jgi:hypothetical protein
VADRTPDLPQVTVDGELVALRLLADRPDEIATTRTRTANRLHRRLPELGLSRYRRRVTAARLRPPSSTPRRAARLARHAYQAVRSGR